MAKMHNKCAFPPFQYIPPVTPRAAPIENPKCSIKFSACTALYVPPK